MKFNLSLAARRTRRLRLLQNLSFAVLASSALLAPRFAFAGNDAFDTNPVATGGTANFSGNFTLGTTTPAAGGTGTPASGDALYFGTSSTTTLNDDLAAGTTFAGLVFNSGASAFTIGGNAFTLSADIVNNSASAEIINNAITLTQSQAFSNTAGGGSLSFGGGVSGAGYTLTTNGGPNGAIAPLNTTFTAGTVTLGTLNAQGNGNATGDYNSNQFTTFNGTSVLNASSVNVQRSNLVFGGNSVVTVTGNIGQNDSWGNLVITGSTNVTAANVLMNSNGSDQTGQLLLNGGTVTTGSLGAYDRGSGNFGGQGQQSALVFNGTQINASASSTSFVSISTSNGGANEAFVGTGGMLLNTGVFNETIGCDLLDLNSTIVGTNPGLRSLTAGPGSLTKTGTGTLTLNGNNGFSGGLTIGNGVLYLSASNQPGTGNLTFGTAGAANTTVLSFSSGGRTFSNPIVTQGTGGTNTIQSQGAGQNFSLSGGITLGNNLTLSTTNGSDSLSVDGGAIGGTGNLIANVTTISAGGVTAAGTVNATGGGITFNSAINNVGTFSNVSNGTGTVTVNGSFGPNVTNVIQNSATSLLNLPNVNTNVNLTVANGMVGHSATTPTNNSLGSGTITLGTAGVGNTAMLQISNQGRSFSNPLVSTGTGGTNTLLIAGGAQTFTFTGGATLASGATASTLLLTTGGGSGNDDAISFTGGVTGTGNLITQAGAAATTGGGGITISGGAVNHVGTITNSGTTMNSAGTLISANIGSNVTGVTQNNAHSPLTLAGTNLYTGPTTVSAGTLTVSGSINASTSVQVGNTGALTLTNSASLSDAGTLSLVTGATLNLNDPNTGGTSSEVISSLILNGTTEAPGTYNATQLAGLPGASGITFASSFGETLTIAPVPEPATWFSGVFCVGALGWFIRRRLTGALNDRQAA